MNIFKCDNNFHANAQRFFGVLARDENMKSTQRRIFSQEKRGFSHPYPCRKLSRSFKQNIPPCKSGVRHLDFAIKSRFDTPAFHPARVIACHERLLRLFAAEMSYFC